jgi:hypothetical protein
MRHEHAAGRIEEQGIGRRVTRVVEYEWNAPSVRALVVSTNDAASAVSAVA